MTVDVAGFLVCVPMLKEWDCGEEIRGLDGWTFQVKTYLVLEILDA